MNSSRAIPSPPTTGSTTLLPLPTARIPACDMQQKYHIDVADKTLHERQYKETKSANANI